MRTKIEVARNFYKSARECSSSPELEEESYKIMDHLLRCNGYSNPRDMIKTHIKGISGPPMDSSSVSLKLPYISEQITDQILKFIKTVDFIYVLFSHQERSLGICFVVHVPAISQFVNLRRVKSVQGW